MHYLNYWHPSFFTLERRNRLVLEGIVDFKLWCVCLYAGCGITAVLWQGMICYGMAWCGVMWYGIVWCGMVWYRIVWYGMI